MDAANNTPQDLDIGEFEDLPTNEVVIKNPVTEAPTSAVITVMGPEHPERKKIIMDRARKNRAEFQRTGRITATDPLEDIDNDTDFMVATTVGWRGLKFAGEALAFSPQAARTLYTDPKRQWLRAQIRKALEESNRFISSSAKA